MGGGGGRRSEGVDRRQTRRNDCTQLSRGRGRWVRRRALVPSTPPARAVEDRKLFPSPRSVSPGKAGQVGAASLGSKGRASEEGDERVNAQGREEAKGYRVILGKRRGSVFVAREVGSWCIKKELQEDGGSTSQPGCSYLLVSAWTPNTHKGGGREEKGDGGDHAVTSITSARRPQSSATAGRA